MTLVIDTRCTACGVCIATCPTSALTPAPRKPKVEQEACTYCLACVEVCPRDAISASLPEWSKMRSTAVQI